MDEENFEVFCQWLKALSTNEEHPYLANIVALDVRPCLAFKNKEVRALLSCSRSFDSQRITMYLSLPSSCLSKSSTLVNRTPFTWRLWLWGRSLVQWAGPVGVAVWVELVLKQRMDPHQPMGAMGANVLGTCAAVMRIYCAIIILCCANEQRIKLSPPIRSIVTCTKFVVPSNCM